MAVIIRALDKVSNGPSSMTGAQSILAGSQMALIRLSEGHIIGLKWPYQVEGSQSALAGSQMALSGSQKALFSIITS